MKPIKEYEIVDHGFDGEQYFQGCGVAFSDFDDVATGMGDTAREAFDDALDNLAENDWDVSKIKGKSKLSRQGVRGYLRSIGIKLDPDGDGSETHYYLSIRVR